MQNDTSAQETLVNGIINFYSNLEEANHGKLFLQLKCIEYLKNFYNNHQFKINKYAHLLGKVIPLSNQMIMKFSESTEEHTQMIINEVLELYRFVVEKYAAFNQIS